MNVDEIMAGGVPQTSEDHLLMVLMVARLWESDVVIFTIDNPHDITDDHSLQLINAGSKSDTCRCILLRLIHVPYLLLRINVPMSSSLSMS